MHPPSSYHTVTSEIPNATEQLRLAEIIHAQTFRYDLNAPGFSLLSFACSISSEQMRGCMVDLKRALDALHHARAGKRLVYLSMARFDQQTTTKFHLDGAPPESFLMLGYEPSEVDCELAMADFSLASWKLGIEPARFIEVHNPMYASGAKLLEGTITPLTDFDPSIANILVINNSSQAFDGTGKNLLGVMHQATIPHPDPSRRRIINSTMIGCADDISQETVPPSKQTDYVATTHVSGPVGY
jgi:hypothetical protein